MSKEQYEELPLTHLSEEQLEDLLRYHEPFTEDSLASIEKRFSEKINGTAQPKPVQKKSYKRLLLMAASLLLFAVGFTQLDAVEAFYYHFFGDTEGGLVEQGEALTSVVENQGIELKALSTFQDGETTYFLMQLTDLTGDRLDETVNRLEWKGMGLSPSRFIAFEESTNTATFLTRIDSNALDAANHELTLLSFQSQIQTYQKVSDIQLMDVLSQEATWEAFSDSAPFQPREQLDSITFQALKERIAGSLHPGELDIPLLEPAEVTLSNVGYKAGLLHVQVKGPNERNHSFINLELQNMATGETLHPLVSMMAERRTLNVETGRTDYLEFVFEVPQENLNQYHMLLAGERYDVYQDGEWALDVTAVESVEMKTYQDISVSVEGQIIKLSDIQLSPVTIGFSVYGSGKEDKTLDEMLRDTLAVQVTLKDGTVQEFNRTFQFKTVAGEPSRVQMEGPYVDLDEVVEITINGQSLQER